MLDGHRRGLWEGRVRRRRWLIAGLLLLGGLLVGLLALLFKDFVRESILVPLAYTVSGARVVVNVLPQVVWWMAFLLVTLFIVVGAVLVALPAPRRSGAPDEPRPGRVETWMRWIDLAAGGGDQYSRQDLARRVRDLTLGALAARDGSASLTTSLPIGVTRAEAWPAKSPRSPRPRAERGGAGTEPPAGGRWSGERSRRVESRLRSRALPAPLGSPEGGPVPALSAAEGAQAQVSEIDIERIVQYLEEEMEVPRGA